MGADEAVSYKKQGRDEATGWSYNVTVTVSPLKNYLPFPTYGSLLAVSWGDFEYDEDSCVLGREFDVLGGFKFEYQFGPPLADHFARRGSLPLAACKDAFDIISAHTHDNKGYEAREEEIKARVRVEMYVPEDEPWDPIDTYSMLLDDDVEDTYISGDEYDREDSKSSEEANGGIGEDWRLIGLEDWHFD